MACMIHRPTLFVRQILDPQCSALWSSELSKAVPKTEGREDSLNSRRAALREKHLLGFRPSAFFRISAFGLRISIPPATVLLPSLALYGCPAFGLTNTSAPTGTAS